MRMHTVHAQYYPKLVLYELIILDSNEAIRLLDHQVYSHLLVHLQDAIVA